LSGEAPGDLWSHVRQADLAAVRAAPCTCSRRRQGCHRAECHRLPLQLAPYRRHSLVRVRVPPTSHSPVWGRQVVYRVRSQYIRSRGGGI